MTALAAGLLAVGCGADEPSTGSAPATRFEQALELVGEGVAPSGTGYGWIDLRSGRDAKRFAGALGPGLSDLFAHPDRLRAVGIDISHVEAATSLVASYGYAVRLDGVSGERLAQLLEAAGATTREVDVWSEYDLGAEWEAPLRGPLAEVGNFAARAAVADDAVILSRTGSAREALEDRGEPPLDDPGVAAAAGCLGDVRSARTLPGSFTYNPGESPELIAAGVAPGRPSREVLCVLGESAAQARRWESELSRSFAASAVSPVAEGDLHGARAAIAGPDAGEPGALYGALVSGRVLGYLGAPSPIPPGTGTDLGREGR